MLNQAVQKETLNPEVANYIRELETNLKEYQYKYLEIKEKYDLLVYKRFARSAEQLLADDKQPSLFTEEAGEAETTEEAKPQEFSEVKSHKRNKAGRKPIDPNLKREPGTIDIPESEKTCACGAALTRIGEEISEKLIIVPPKYMWIR